LRLSRLLNRSSLLFKQDPEIKGITDDSRKVEKGFLFFAIKGTKTDGNLFVKEAIEKGAVAVITDDFKTVKNFSSKVPVVFTRNVRKVKAEVASRFFNFPHLRLNLFGITGTNGKTTTAYALFRLLNALGEKTAIISTIETGLPENLKPSSLTTPDSIDFFKILKEFADSGVKNVVVEVSSHALELYRIHPARFKAGIFTNLSQDHLDFHGNLYDYFASKAKLYYLTDEVFAINNDDPFSKIFLLLAGSARKVTFGTSKDSDYRFYAKGNEVFVEGKNCSFKFKKSMIGIHNAYNFCGSIAVLKELGYDVSKVLEEIEKIKVKGRLEEVSKDVFVDYAHTPDALEKSLNALKELKKKILLVFGCGGERDREKRSKMGEVAEKLADLIVITNDNPRNENPSQIIQDILSGIRDTQRVVVIQDREEAIKFALKEKKEDYVVLISGKGHETYQIVGNKKIPFDDKKIVLKYVSQTSTNKSSSEAKTL